MALKALLSWSCAIPLAAAVIASPYQGKLLRGFNYDPSDDFASLLPAAQKLKIDSTPFNSARTYTALKDENIADAAAAQPHPIFKAAVASKTVLLISLACSKGNTAFGYELAALEKVLQSNETTGENNINVFKAGLVAGITVGNEDLYRTSVQGTPAAASLGAGDTVENLKSYISQTRALLQKYGYGEKIPISHTDTWQIWTNAEYGKQLLPVIDFVCMQGFLYWQGYEVHNTSAFADEALAAVTAAAGSLPVWITETGWPISGTPYHPEGSTDPKLLAVAGTQEAQIYWKNVGCDLLFKSTEHPTWWFQLYSGAQATTGADAGINWSVLSGVANGVGQEAFPLACDQTPPTVQTATWGSAPAGPTQPPAVKPRAARSAVKRRVRRREGSVRA